MMVAPFGRRDDIGGGACSGGLREFDLAVCAERLCDGRDRFEDSGFALLLEVPACDPDAEVLLAEAQLQSAGFGGVGAADGIEQVGSVDGVKSGCQIFCGASEGANVIQASDEEKSAATRDAAVGGLQAEDATEGGRHADGAIGVRTEGEGDQAGRDGSG
jgi:hypothetical protein